MERIPCLKLKIKQLLFVFCIILSGNIFAQNPIIPDSIIQQIPDSVTKNQQSFAHFLQSQFTNDEEIATALYIWLAKKMYYDLDMLQAPLQYESLSKMVEETLQTRRGTCGNYAEAFTTILTSANIPAFTISGYVKINGTIDTITGHAWNVAKINELWKLFDPTWGGGYVRYERFHRRFTMKYCMIDPDSLILSHMPYDPLWQLKEQPFTHNLFCGDTSEELLNFNFADSIQVYALLNEFEQAKSAKKRAQNFHIDYPEIRNLRSQYYNSLDEQQKTYCIDIYNSIIEEANKRNFYHNKQTRNQLKGQIKQCQNMVDELMQYDTTFQSTGQSLVETLNTLAKEIH
jgi:hypothetical protein